MSDAFIPYVEAIEVTRTFGRHFALHRASVRLEAGQVSLILGPNGAGKSTFLSILATLDAPTSGQFRFGPTLNHRQMTKRGRREIGWVSHDSLVYAELTGRENLRFYGELYGVPNLPNRIHSLIDRVGLTEAVDRSVNTYSRGMRQRLSVARAMLQDPSLLVLDEPFSGLDRQGRLELVEILRQAAAAGKLVALSTHILDLPAHFVDHLVILRRGRVRFAGPLKGELAACYDRVVQGQKSGNTRG